MNSQLHGEAGELRPATRSSSSGSPRLTASSNMSPDGFLTRPSSASTARVAQRVAQRASTCWDGDGRCTSTCWDGEVRCTVGLEDREVSRVGVPDVYAVPRIEGLLSGRGPAAMQRRVAVALGQCGLSMGGRPARHLDPPALHHSVVPVLNVSHPPTPTAHAPRFVLLVLLHLPRLPLLPENYHRQCKPSNTRWSKQCKRRQWRWHKHRHS